MEHSITPELKEKINALQTILDNGKRIVFSAVPVSVQKAASPTFEVPMACITKNTNIIRKLF